MKGDQIARTPIQEDCCSGSFESDSRDLGAGELAFESPPLLISDPAHPGNEDGISNRSLGHQTVGETSASNILSECPRQGLPKAFVMFQERRKAIARIGPDHQRRLWSHD